MPNRPLLTRHPEFERVAARYRNAIRRRDDAAIDRARADLHRLVRAVAQAEAWREAAEQAFTTNPERKQRRNDMATWDQAKDEARRSAPKDSGDVFVKLKEDGARVELAIVGEPHIYWRISFDEPSRETKRFLMNTFVRGQGMRVLEATAATFGALAVLRDEIDFEKRTVVIERKGKARDPSTRYGVLAGSAITRELAAEIKAAKPHDLAEVAARQSEAATSRARAGTVQTVKTPSPDRRTA
ncbi:MAG TPA: hypothetical protein VFF73_07705 [Planctomycetota bacterium]|nr:hypothetical protein [Planctomycetota bacterium]